MLQLKREELLEIQGGFGTWTIMGIISGITFFIGLIDGFVRPLPCRK